MLIDAFWINYPYCWNGSPVTVCRTYNITNAPGPGVKYILDDNFWDDYQGESAPSGGSDYENYWTSFHNPGPKVIADLRQQIEDAGTNTITGQKIKLPDLFQNLIAFVDLPPMIQHLPLPACRLSQITVSVCCTLLSFPMFPPDLSS